ncbi:MAG: hypothetical protein H6718_04765 [Polyangiaceae bacterium]|nr:hypothetical protein [Myxococcales bacterium]MCB9584683.1 hypothetical protein [Polyangiaceae bacterium]MCB9609120.1 hypothetical protein [Polyangiaceae bacterium]
MSRVWGLGCAAALTGALLCWGCAESETLKHYDAPQGGASGSAGAAGSSQQGGSSGNGGSSSGGGANGGSSGAAQGGSAGQGAASNGGSANGGSSGSANGGSANGGSANGGSANGGSANGGSAGQPSGMDPALGLPDGNGDPCSNVGGSCTAADGPGVCRIYSQTEGRCESCTTCNNLNQFCTQSSDCDILFQCYQGQCLNLCDLSIGCSGVTDWCVNVGNSQYGVCVYPN